MKTSTQATPRQSKILELLHVEIRLRHPQQMSIREMTKYLSWLAAE